jgi:hypothetical protein
MRVRRGAVSPKPQQPYGNPLFPEVLDYLYKLDEHYSLDFRDAECAYPVNDNSVAMLLGAE